MCRWLGYIGNPIRVSQLVMSGDNSIVEQSLDSHQGAEPTNGDGFGVGWWAAGSDVPSRYRCTEPAWNDENLREVTGQLQSHCVLMHVRAAIGSPVQLSNCHPFRRHDLLFVHNGLISDFGKVRRRLLYDVKPELFSSIHGTTDSELLFHLALGYGLRDDPRTALELATGHIEAVLQDEGLTPNLQLSIGVADGTKLHAVRYASQETPRTLYVSENVETVRDAYPHLPAMRVIEDGARIVVSEPPRDLPGAWHEVNPSTFLTTSGDGTLEFEVFEPRVPESLQIGAHA